MKQITYIWNSRWSLAIIAGLLLGLSYPPVPAPFLLFPAWLLLFRLAELCESNRSAILWSYIAFVIWNLVTTYWLMMATLAGGIAAILANSAVMTLPFALQRQFQNKFSSSALVAVSQAAVWTGYEFLHHNWDLAWPWLSLGNAWSNTPALVQYISYTGYLGISFWVLVTAALAYQALHRSSKTTAISAISFGLLLPLISLFQYSAGEYPSERSLQTAVIQPNYDTYYTYGGYNNAFEALDAIMELTDSVKTDSTELIIWPENGIRSRIHSKSGISSTSDSVKNILFGKVAAWDATLISGSSYFEYFGNDENLHLPRNSAYGPYHVYNSGLGIQPDSSLEIYRKHNLVPIVERIPFVHTLDNLDPFDWINWNRIQGYGKGYDASRIAVENTYTPALVCYDSIFPGWVREYIKKDVGFLTVITNDGWWGNTSGHEQHFAYARLRAIEFRRWVVRSANNGISGVINPRGGIEVETEYWTRTGFRYDIPIRTEETLFARWGDWFSYLTLIAALFGTGDLLRRRFLEK